MTTKAELTPLAEILVSAYMAAAIYSREFLDEHGVPPTMLAKMHHIRSVVQAEVQRTDRYKLGTAYVEYSRVEITDLETQRSYLLQSQNSVLIDRRKRQREALFDATSYIRSDVQMLVYDFRQEGLDLSLCGTHRKADRRRLRAIHVPSFVATWPYDAGTPPHFDQGAPGDPFGDLGRIDLDDDGDNEVGDQ